MAKAEKGDLIRITNAETLLGDYKNGDIFEVTGRWLNGVLIDIDSQFNDIYDTEYEIFRKAGEEDSPNISDAVEHPNHYTQGRFETIEVIEQFTSGYDDGFVAHCVGTATKYIARAPYKHETPLEDLRKAAKYLEFAVERLTQNER